ncbi:hypothetical protein D5S17_35965 [Pseudonocardiaceae bacterium YIM PH 21723]|nr:hypothetical protein D5S17_35965 [Pseudonocardiaceae bacterium YIM PH 21723]
MPTGGEPLAASPDQSASDAVKTVRFALFAPGDRLRLVDGPAELDTDEYGDQVQKQLRDKVNFAVDPFGKLTSDMKLKEHGMFIRSPQAARQSHDPHARPALHLYPENHAASAIIASLGGPRETWRGTIAFLGSEDDNGHFLGLDDDQIEVLRKAERLAAG